MVYSNWVLLMKYSYSSIITTECHFWLRGSWWSNILKIFLIKRPLVLFKYYIYVSRSSKVLSFEAFLKFVMKVYELEKTLSQTKERRKKTICKKMENNLAKFVKTIRENELSFLWNELYYRYYCHIQNSFTHVG